MDIAGASRNQADSKLAGLELVRSSIWFDDGNIILVAAGSAAFKVHRGQLERHSEVFHDLFSIPQPKEQVLLDGCFFVDLHDCPSDVFYLLTALYDGLYFKKPYANDFPAIAAVLRLSTKYFIEHLRQRCLTRLEIDWPSTLVGWDIREREAIDHFGRYTPRDSCPHPILAINLALELGLDSILPAAFYDLSRYGPSKIMSGASALPPMPYCSYASKITNPSVVRLSHEQLCKTFIGRESAQHFVATFIDKELKDRPVARDCFNMDKITIRYCVESFYFILLNILRSVGGIACGRDGDPLFTLVQAVEMLSRTDFSDGVRQCGLKMCDRCKGDFAEAVGRAREEVWIRIPEWFGLQSPSEVREGCE